MLLLIDISFSFMFRYQSERGKGSSGDEVTGTDEVGEGEGVTYWFTISLAELRSREGKDLSFLKCGRELKRMPRQ